MLKADLHIHSQYSMDCRVTLEEIIKRCLEIDINCIALADHGTVEGGLKIQAIAPFTVIVAEEILTPYGEIMGMFLKETVPSGIPVEEALQRVKAQDGLVCVPHPYDTLRPSALGGKVLEEIKDDVDIVEVFNARALFGKPYRQAMKFAQKYDLPGSAGSDAHTVGEIGNAYIEMPEFKNKEEFLGSLAQGTISGHRTNPLVHFASLNSKIRKRFK